MRPFIRDLPLYNQFMNGCGLSSLLMLIEPSHNPEFNRFLNDSWEILKKLYKNVSFNEKEYCWAIVLQYILLKYSALLDDDKLNRNPLKAKIHEFLAKYIRIH